jgi:hypothetical protein
MLKIMFFHLKDARHDIFVYFIIGRGFGRFRLGMPGIGWG